MDKVKKLFTPQHSYDEEGKSLGRIHSGGAADYIYRPNDDEEEAAAAANQGDAYAGSEDIAGTSSTGQAVGASGTTSGVTDTGATSQYTSRDSGSASGAARNAPQIGKQDLGESLGSGYGGNSNQAAALAGNEKRRSSSTRYSGSNFVVGGTRGYGLDKSVSGEKYGTTSTSDPSYRGSQSGATSGTRSSELATAGGAAGAGAGLTGASLADRSVGEHSGTTSSGAVGSGTVVGNNQTTFAERGADLSGSAHPTFTGNRLDPGFHESTQSYHEEVLDDKTHHGGGWTGASSGAHSSAAPGTATTTSGSTAVPSYSSAAPTSSDPYSSAQPTSSSHNYGRDAAVGAGAAGVGGAAAYGMLDKDKGQAVDTSNTGPASNTTGPHSSNIANVVDPRVKPEPAQNSSSGYGRDGAVVGGAGAAGAGAYSANQPTAGAGYTQQPTSQTTDSGHHYGRDAAVVGSVGAAGAAGYGAYEATQSHPTSGATTGTSGHPHHDPYSTEHHADREADWRKQTRGGSLGFLHADHKHGRFDDPEEPNTTAREKYYGTGNDHATHSRDTAGQTSGPSGTTAAATGAGVVGAGAAGVGASSLASHFAHHDPTGPGLTHGASTGDHASHYRASALKESSLKAFYDDPTGVHQSHGLNSGLPAAYGHQLHDEEEKHFEGPSSAAGAHDAAEKHGSGGTQKRSLMDRVLHRDAPNKLQKDPPS